MQFDQQREKLFNNQIRNLRIEQMTNILRCFLCSGLYRFAHTLIDCGHTFCQQCIFDYIKGFKGRYPQVKCPQCHSSIQPLYQKSIMKDVFKQSLIDLLEPEYSKEELLIINRIQTLFPEFNLNFLLDQFNFSSIESSKIRKKKSQKSQIMTKLPMIVKQKLGLSFQVFTQMIVQNEHYQSFLDKINKITQMPELKSLVLDLRPRNERDFSYVGINNKMKINNFNVLKIRKFLQKKLLIKLQTSDKYTQDLVNADNDKLQIKIALYLQNRLLQDGETLSQMQIGENPIYYALV